MASSPTTLTQLRALARSLGVVLRDRNRSQLRKAIEYAKIKTQKAQATTPRRVKKETKKESKYRHSKDKKKRKRGGGRRKRGRGGKR